MSEKIKNLQEFLEIDLNKTQIKGTNTFGKLPLFSDGNNELSLVPARELIKYIEYLVSEIEKMRNE